MLMALKPKTQRKTPRRKEHVDIEVKVVSQILPKCEKCGIEMAEPYTLLGLSGKKVIFKRVLCADCYGLHMDALGRLPYFAVIE
jgi:hypothetical protein